MEMRESMSKGDANNINAYFKESIYHRFKDD